MADAAIPTAMDASPEQVDSLPAAVHKAVRRYREAYQRAWNAMADDATSDFCRDSAAHTVADYVMRQ